MAGRSLEALHVQEGQRVQEDRSKQEKPRKSARALRFYGNFNGLTAIGWGTLAVMTGGAGAVIGGTMAAVDTAQFVGSHAAASNLDKKNKRDLIDIKNAEHASSSNGEPKEFPNYDISPTDTYPRTRKQGRFLELEKQARVPSGDLKPGKSVGAINVQQLRRAV